MIAWKQLFADSKLCCENVRLLNKKTRLFHIGPNKQLH